MSGASVIVSFTFEYAWIPFHSFYVRELNLLYILHVLSALIFGLANIYMMWFLFILLKCVFDAVASIEDRIQQYY